MYVSLCHFFPDSASKGSADFHPGLTQPGSQVQSSWKLVSPWAKPVPGIPGHPSLLTNAQDESSVVDLCKSIPVQEKQLNTYSRLSVTSPYTGGCKPRTPSSPTDAHVQFQWEGGRMNSTNTRGEWKTGGRRDCFLHVCDLTWGETDIVDQPGRHHSIHQGLACWIRD